MKQRKRKRPSTPNGGDEILILNKRRKRNKKAAPRPNKGKVKKKSKQKVDKQINVSELLCTQITFCTFFDEIDVKIT